MPRAKRLHYPGELIQMVSRGVRRNDIFEAPRQWTEFLRSLRENALAFGMTLYAYALMPNHFHILARLGQLGPSAVMHRTLTKFAIRSNLVNGRKGHVFEAPYKSSTIQTDVEAREQLRYIHNNPLRAHLAEDFMDWPWTSHKAYLGIDPDPMVDTSFMLSLFSEDPEVARQRYRDFMGAPPQSKQSRPKRDISEIQGLVCSEDGISATAIRTNSKDCEVVRARHRFIRLADAAGIPGPDIAAYLGVARSTVFRALRT